jgi:predicted lipoprotein with Yx(FWY)xxD motif
MKILVGLLLAIIIIIGGWFVWSSVQPAASAPSFNAAGTNAPVIATSNAAATASQTPQIPQVPTGPSTSGNIIDPGSEAPSIVGNNLMLGIDENASLGMYLVGYTGMTLYTYEKDTGASSTCYDQCAETWPPYTVSSSDAINTQYGVNASKVSIIARADGTLQVAYNGHPLYFYAGDTQETTNGQGLGGVWYVIKP